MQASNERFCYDITRYAPIVLGVLTSEAGPWSSLEAWSILDEVSKVLRAWTNDNKQDRTGTS